jgi:hypothetical protein
MSGKATCRACGVGLRSAGRVFCAPLCAMAAMFERRAMGKAIVEIGPAGVKCLLCNKSFSQAGSHFSGTHGMDLNKRMGQLARLAAYGLPAGARLASESLRSIYRQNMLAKRESGAVMPTPFAPGNREGAKQLIAVIPSAAQAAGARKIGASNLAAAAAKKKADAMEGRVCPVCGAQYTRRRGIKTKCCSRKCGLALAVRNFAARESASATCAVCGTGFLRRHASKTTCSSACYRATRTTHRQGVTA